MSASVVMPQLGQIGAEGKVVRRLDNQAFAY
jgi:hypothetical protein